ncbi:hypothetical protein BH10ACT7_BH10ACT7_24680 [soil metagenome]
MVTGRLNLRPEPGGDSIQYRVRDAAQTLVYSGGSGETEVAPGLYSVTAVTASGERLTQLVTVGSRAAIDVDFTPAADSAPVRPDAIDGVVARAVAPRPTRRFTLVNATGCTATQDGAGWRFVPGVPPIGTATALFTDGGSQWELSLPLNPEGPSGGCRVDVVDGAPRVTLDEGRGLALTIDGMLRNDTITSGTSILEQASGLLDGKYNDPVGAALGGLTLHRLGFLADRAQWVENLARDFPWLVDGRVLLAALLRDDPDAADRRRGLDALLSAAEGRPVFTDGLSLLVELLRRWPRDTAARKRAEALEGLSYLTGYAIWDSVSLATVVTIE